MPAPTFSQVHVLMDLFPRGRTQTRTGSVALYLVGNHRRPAVSKPPERPAAPPKTLETFTMRSLLALALALGAPAAWADSTPTDISPQVLKIARDVRTAPGRLPQLEVTIDGQKRPLPLRHTNVFAELSGHVARVDVTQTYKNDHDRAIEAIYVFPLPENSAVDDLKIEVGGRVIVAEIQKRADARQTYEDARRAGQTAALLEQERPNIFTQSVANIPPGEEVKVHVRFVQQLTYAAGEYEWVFPMVVGPRFIPGNPEGKQGVGWSADTDSVPDASRITPPIVGAGMRSGHDLSLEVVIDSPLPVQDLQTPTHAVDAVSEDSTMRLTLSKADERPNRDFVLRYTVESEQAQVAVMAHKKGDEGHLTLVVQPPRLDVEALVGKRELIFVVDVSGSMNGKPLAQAKEAARIAIGQLGPDDTFNVYTFAGQTTRAFAEPRPANDENIKNALSFLNSVSAGGGTYLADAVAQALTPTVEKGRHRYVLFLTDGYVGNEAEIFAGARDLVAAMQQRGQRARVFALGTGSSVNHHLINGLAEAGKGLGLTITLAEDPADAVRRTFRLIDSPVIRDVVIDWGGLPVEDVYPNVIPDLLASRPLVLQARYTGGGSGVIKVRGTTDDGPVELPLSIHLPETSVRHPATPTLWARARVAELEKRLWDGHDQPAIDAITETGLKHRIVTAYTSFVAVDRSRKVGNGKAPTVVQPTEAPEGVDLSTAAPPNALFGAGGLGLRGSGTGGGGYGVGAGRMGRMSARRQVTVRAGEVADPGVSLGLDARGTRGRGAVGHKVGAGDAGGSVKVRAAASIVTGSLDKALIQRVMRRHQAGIRYCYEKALQKTPSLAGKVVFKFTITAEGLVTLVEVVEDTLKDPEAVACMTQRVGRMKFPTIPGGGTAQVSYPFVFQTISEN